MNLDQYNQKTRQKVLIYGPPKTGKTALAGKLASNYKLHWIDLENGIKTLLNPAVLAPEHRKNVNVINVPDHRLYPVAIDTVRDVLKGGSKRICHNHGKVNCPLCAKQSDAAWSDINILDFGDEDILVIDSLTQLSNSAINKVTLKELQKPGGEDYKFTWEDYRSQSALLDQCLSLIQVLDLNIIVISHEVEAEMNDGKDKIVPVAGTRNFSKMCAKYFDEVVYCTVTNKAHRAYSSTNYSPTVLTGGRSGVTMDDRKEAELSLLPIFKRSN
jgi:hypothetical protein